MTHTQKTNNARNKQNKRVKYNTMIMKGQEGKKESRGKKKFAEVNSC